MLHLGSLAWVADSAELEVLNSPFDPLGCCSLTFHLRCPILSNLGYVCFRELVRCGSRRTLLGVVGARPGAELLAGTRSRIALERQ